MDVFISYKRDQRERVKVIADVLEDAVHPEVVGGFCWTTKRGWGTTVG